MRKLRNWFILYIVAISVSFVPLSVRADILLEAESECELAFHLIQNLQNNMPGRRVRVPAGLDMDKVFGYVDAVWPEKVWIGGLQIPVQGGAVCDYYVKLRDPNTEQAQRRAFEIAAQITQPQMTDAEKIQSFHDYLVKHCEPDGEAQNAVESGAADAVDMFISSFSVSGALLEGKAVCDGYTGAMMSLCRAAGIPCFRMTSQSMNHSVNYIFDGTFWSYTDITWDDSGNCGDYLMCPEEQFLLSHYFDDTGAGVTLEEYKAFFNYYLERSAALQPPSTDMIAARMLHRIGMFQGTENGFELDRPATRNEMAVMLVRVLGQEALVESGGFSCPFGDAGWASNYVGYLYQNGLVAGISDTEFGGDDIAGRNDYATLLLRTLQYNDREGDFSWETAAQSCVALGIIPPDTHLNGEFLRGDMAQMTLHTLMSPRKTDGDLLLNWLTKNAEGVRPLIDDLIAEYASLPCFD